MTDNTERDKIIDRCRKLTKMTIEHGCSEAEAATAAKLLASLVAAWDVTQDEMAIRANAEGCIEDSYLEFNSQRAEWTNCCGAIMELFSVRCYFTHETEVELGLKIQKICYYGFPIDVAASLAVSAIVAMAINTESGNFVKLGKKSRKKSLPDFRYGMAERLKERIIELSQIRKFNKSMSTGTSLIILKDQLVTENYFKRYPHMRAAPKVGGNIKDFKAYQEGRKMAEGVDFSFDGKVRSSTQGLLS